MKKTSSCLKLLILFTLGACASDPAPKKTPNLPKSRSSYYKSHQSSQTYNDIDIDALITELGLDQSIEQIGYQEKVFNTCQIRANRSQNPFCQNLYLGRLNYQVMCRDSTGTVETVRLSPLNNQRLRWKNRGKRGFTRTNANGFGQLGFISQHSSKSGHLYLYLGNKVARKRFHDLWKLILPKSWCLY